MPARLYSRIPAIITEMALGTNTAAEAAANDIAERARARAPVLTGTLRNSIHVEPTEGGFMVVADAADPDGYLYAQVVEYGGHTGGSGTGPNAFLTPAAEEVRASYLGAIAAVVRSA